MQEEEYSTLTMFTLDQTDCRVITAPLSLSLFLASQVNSFSHLCFPHHHHRPNSTQKSILDHPLRSTIHFSSPTRFTHTPLKLTHTPLKITHINKLKISACAPKSTPVTERLISAALYTAPFLESLGYGAHRIPLDLYPRIYHLYTSTPLTRIVAFYITLVFVIQNPKFRKYVKINAVQAIILGFLFQVPFGFLKIIFPVWPVGMRIGCDFMFLSVVFSFIYVMVNTILGKTPEFPFVTDAAKTQLPHL